MAAKIINQNEKEITIQIKVKFERSMLSSEENIQKSLNEAGVLATREALRKFDTDGSPIKIGNIKLTSMGQVYKEYETPYGKISLNRHVYQSSKGGKTYCPLENDARIFITSTPKFARMISFKYGEDGSTTVARDFEENHGRKIHRAFIQNVAEAVGTLGVAKEENWEYSLPEMEKPVSSISIGLDGTCMLLCKDGYREAMVGTIGFFDKEGERLHTIYTAATPEYGKETFLNRFEREVERVKNKYPNTTYVGIADGSSSNWGFLEKHTEIQTLDFWHVTQYLSKFAKVMYPGKKNLSEKEKWLERSCHNLKHHPTGANVLLKEMINYRDNHDLKNDKLKDISDSITYFKNQKNRMNYSNNVIAKLPIGSGITESACKYIVKKRLCNSGMKWVDKGASVVLSIRTLIKTQDRWQQFWDKIDRYGCSIAA